VASRPGLPALPRPESDHASTGGRVGLYRCGPCKKKFTIKVGTILESSHIPMTQWLQAIYFMVSSKKGFSSHQMMRAMDIQYKSAWFLTHRIREAMKEQEWREAGPLGGGGMTVEADETYMGGKAHNRAFGPIPHKSPVVSLVERNGRIRSLHVPNVTANNLAPLIARHAHPHSRFMTDKSNVYSHAGTWFKGHETVNHSIKEYVRDDAYTNTIEGFFSILKRGIYGVYQHG
jgi:transposase-like protein